MRILIINHYSGSPRLGMEFRHYSMAREFRKAGHEVLIVASRYSHLRREQPTGADIAAGRLDAIDHAWLAGSAYDGNGVGRALNMFGFGADLWREARRFATGFRPDVVYASSPHPFLSYGAARIARLAGALYLFEIRDLWPASLVQLFDVNPRHPMALAMDRAEAHGCRHAGLVNSLLPSAEAYFAGRGVEPERYASVSNGVDPEDWQPTDAALPEIHQRWFDAQRDAGNLVLAYTGTLGPANCLDELLDAAKLLEGSRVRVAIVGKGTEESKLRARIEREHLSGVSLLPAVPKALMPKLLAGVDVCYAGYQPMPMYAYGVCANKLMDYMMAGKVVLLAINSAVDVVSRSGAGVVCEPGNAEALAGAALDLAARPAAELVEMGARARAYILAEHTYPVLAERLLAATAGRMRA